MVMGGQLPKRYEDEYAGGSSSSGNGGGGDSKTKIVSPIIRVGNRESGLEELCKNLNNQDKNKEKIPVEFMSDFNDFLKCAGLKSIGLAIFGLDSGDMRSNAYTTVEKLRNQTEYKTNSDLIVIGVEPKTPRVTMVKEDWFAVGGDIYLKADTEKIYFEVLVNSLYGKSVETRTGF